MHVVDKHSQTKANQVQDKGRLTMRAKMSDRAEREPRLHGASWQDFDGVRSLHLLEAEALAEARAILAETEQIETYVYGHHRFEGDYLKAELSRDYNRQGVAELADALRAFVEA
jgi:homoserine trans-succinylase